MLDLAAEVTEAIIAGGLRCANAVRGAGKTKKRRYCVSPQRRSCGRRTEQATNPGDGNRTRKKPVELSDSDWE